MQVLTFWSLCVFLTCVKGQTTQTSGYYCTVNDLTVNVQRSYLSHSAWQSSSGCSLPLCSSSTNSSSCRLSSTPCFNYLTVNNVSYCAPGGLCSLLQPCNNITGTCSLNTSVCVVNSCCQPQAVCLPSAWISLCSSNAGIVLQWNTTATIVAGTGMPGTGATQLGGSYGGPYGIYIDQNDMLYIADRYNHRIQQWALNATFGTTVAGVTSTSGSASGLLNQPTDIYVDKSLNMYILDAGNYRVVRWPLGASSGIIIAGTGVQGNTANTLGLSMQMCVDTTNSLIYIADNSNGRIIVWQFFASSSTMIIPYTGVQGITIDQASASVYASAMFQSGLFQYNYLVTRFSLGSTNGTLLASASSGLYFPYGLDFDIYGNLYVVVNTNPSSVLQFCAGFTINSTGITVANGTGFSTDLSFDSHMNLFVSDWANYQVVKYARLR